MQKIYKTFYQSFIYVPISVFKQADQNTNVYISDFPKWLIYLLWDEFKIQQKSIFLTSILIHFPWALIVINSAVCASLEV